MGAEKRPGPNFLYASAVAMIAGAIIGVLGWFFQQPLLFPSLGPTIFIHTVSPEHDSAKPWNTFAGHAIGAAAAFLALAIFGALRAPPAMTSGHIVLARLAASAMAVGLTTGVQIPLRAVHAPAAATTLLITLGGLTATWSTVALLAIGVAISSLLCSVGRWMMGGRFRPKE